MIETLHKKSTTRRSYYRSPRRIQRIDRGLSHPAEDTLKIIPLGGLEEVGRNMTVFEYDSDIIVIDMGLQFPEEDMPGIDYIIPNAAYLQEKTKNIRGVIITHGHYDHIGAIPHIMPKIGNPPIYTAALTAAIIKKRQEDYPNGTHLNLNIVKKKDRVRLGCFEAEFFRLNHNIPDSLGIALHTPVGTVIYTGDFKFDHSPVGDEPADIAHLAQLGARGVLLLMSDSTDADTPGYSISEKTIQDTLDDIFKNAEGRIIAATFSSLISRLQELIYLAEKYHRKVVVDGYSMKTNVEIARNLGYLKVKKDTFINIERLRDWPDNKILVLCTGAQGEDRAVLMRIVNKEHRFIRIKAGDTVIFSSSVIPGNERTVQHVKDTLSRHGAKIIHYQMMDVHAGGHAQVEDLKMMINLVRPTFFIPIHGNYYMLKLHAELAQTVGVPEKNIVIPDNGQIVEVTAKNIRLTDKRAPTNYIMVDGLGIGDVGQVVLRDRQMMSKDGMFTIIVIIDSKTGKIIQDPDIISRGFVYMKESGELLAQTKRKVKQIIAQKTKETPINWAYIRSTLRDSIGQFLYSKTQRRPMILPVVIEV
ncbi:MAG: ribonuclease J [bacterium]